MDCEKQLPVNKTPLKAIRAKCLDCCCRSSHEVRLCPCYDCSLWPFRFGRNPNIPKREMTEEQRKEMEERLAVAREKRNKGI